MFKLLRVLRFLSPLSPARKIVTRRVREGDRRLLPLAIVLWAPVVLGKMGKRQESIIAVEKLEPGEALILRTIPRATKAERETARALIGADADKAV